jgi:hypothetical protein
MATTKIAIGVGLMAAGVAAAIAGPMLLAPRVDPAVGNDAASAASKEAAAALHSSLEALEAAATEAAGMEPLRAAISNKVDATTMVDLFATEDWWRAKRTAFPLSRTVVGSSVATFGDLPLGEQDRDIVATARKARVASGYVVVEGRAIRLGAARIDVREEVAPVLVLGLPLDESALRKLADRTQMGLVLSAGEKPILMAASSDAQRATLEMLARRADGSAMMKPDEGWVAGSAELGPGLRVWGLRAMAASGRGGSPTGAYVLGALFVVAGVAFMVLARGKPAAASSNAAPGAVIPAESTMPFGTSSRNQRPRNDTETDLAAIPAPPPHKLTPMATHLRPSEKPRTFGRYRLLDLLGVGGMSEVYTAVAHGAEGFQRTFVVKRLRPELARDREAISQFIDEARIQSCLLHSNIVPVFDFGTMGDEYFMAQEYVIGRDLMRLSTRCIEKTNFCLDPRIVYYIAHETLQALAYAHSKHDKSGTPMGIVHRDVSASNIMITAAGDVRLFDFGIAKSQNGQRQAQTQAGLVKGNANFMSPEQARGQTVDSRSDLFSLGMVLYYCMTGCLFYTGDNDLDVLYRAACGPNEQDLAALDQLPGPAGQLLRKALAFKADDRFQTAEEFAAAVAPYAVGMKPEAAKLMESLFGPELHKEAAA